MLNRGLLTGWVVLVGVAGCGASHVGEADLPHGSASPALGASGSTATEPVEGGAGGGPGAAPLSDSPFALSGQRLKAWGFALGGFELFSTFRDRELDFECTFVRGATGDDQRCLPTENADVVYLDAACQLPAMQERLYYRRPLPRWVSGRVPTATGMDAEPERRIGYLLGEVVFAGGLEAQGQTLPKVFQLVGSQCEATSLLPGLLPTGLIALQRQADQTFVSGRVAVRPAGTGFSIQRLVASDGAELTVGVLGSDDVPCELLPGGLCVPGPVSRLRDGAGADAYLDADCTQHAFGPGKLGFEVQGGDSRVYELEPATSAFDKLELLDPATGARLFDAEGNPRFTCTEGSSSPAFARGREVTGQFPRAALAEVNLGRWRLVQRTAHGAGEGVVAGAGTPLEPGATFIDPLGQPCPFESLAARQLVCSPPDPEVYQSEWADPSCSQRLYSVASLDPAGEDLVALRDLDQTEGGAPSLLSFKRYSGTTYSTRNGCTAAGESNTGLFVVDRVMPLPTAQLLELRAQ